MCFARVVIGAIAILVVLAFIAGLGAAAFDWLRTTY
jgi:hypothetical protein